MGCGEEVMYGLISVANLDTSVSTHGFVFSVVLFGILDGRGLYMFRGGCFDDGVPVLFC